MDSHETVVEKQRWLKEEARRAGVKLRMHDSKGSWLEGVLARGDRPLADVIESAWRRGARFDSWEEELRLDAWEAAIAEHGIDTSKYLGTIPMSARLPWDHLDVGLEEGFLAREYRKALKNRLSPPCGKAVGMFVHHTNVREAEADPKKLVCYDCGIACDMGEMRSERLVKLRGLGAVETPADKVPEPPISPKERQKVVTPDQGPPLRVRLSYTRLGRLSFSSHLDMVRLLPRLFRRASLPLYYSQGFHPKAQMTFGPSLRLGVASLSEYLDLKLRRDALPDGIDPEALIERLNAVSLEGLTFERASVLGDEDASLSKLVDEIEYVAAIPRHALSALGVADAAALAARFAERKASGDLWVRRNIKGIGKKVDVGRFLVDAVVSEGADALVAAGIAGDLVPVRLVIAWGPAGTARPTEVLEALGGEGEVSARFVRTRLTFRAEDTSIALHDLDAIRAARQKLRATAAA
jgi:radical SAM-linked protein